MSPDAMRSPTITAAEFAHAYASRGGMTLRQLALEAPDREVAECDCEYEQCEGWQMRSAKWRKRWEGPGIPLIRLLDL